MAEGMTTAQLEQQKKAQEEEKKRLAREQKVRATSEAAAKDATTEKPGLIGSAPFGGYGINAGQAPREVTGQAIKPESATPRVTALRAQEAKGPSAEQTAQAGADSFLQAQMGAGYEGAVAQNADRMNNDPAYRASLVSGKNTNVDTQSLRTPTYLQGVSASIPGGPLQQGAREMLTNTDQVNLGNFGTEGGPNIYGKASTPGGRLDTFTGAGVPGVNVAAGQTTTVSQNDVNRVGTGLRGFNGAGQQLTTQADGSQGVYNPTGYDNANPYGGAHATAALGASARAGVLRASNGAFSGGAGSGNGVRINEIRQINSQANRAFNNALKSGMNTKGALRVAESIRNGAGELNNAEFNRVREKGVDTEASTRMQEAALRQQGALTTAASEAEQARQERDLGLFQDAFPDRMVDGAVVVGSGKQDAAETMSAIGGMEVYSQLNGTQQDKVRKQGGRIRSTLSGLNEYMASKGENVVFDNWADVLAGSKVFGKDGKQRLGVGELSIVDALMQKTVDATDVFDRGVNLGNGITVPMSVWKKLGPQTDDEREAMLLDYDK